jgi:hypothetical protein
MIILAWNGGSLAYIFDPVVFKKVLSIFITSAILNFYQGKNLVLIKYDVFIFLNYIFLKEPCLGEAFYFSYSTYFPNHLL